MPSSLAPIWLLLGVPFFFSPPAFATSARSLDRWFGYNNGEHETSQVSLSDPLFEVAMAAQSLATYRYPAGTAAQYWDWRAGCQQGSNCHGSNNTLEALASFVQRTGVTPIFVVNMLTSTLDDNLAFLAAADALGLVVEKIELGNEFFNDHADFVKAFPSGKEYGDVCNTWIASISAKFPNAVFAAVGQPSVVGNNARKGSWNRAMFSTLAPAHPLVAVTMHEYHDSQIGTAASFKASDISTMLGAPFYWMAGVTTAIAANVPAPLSMWMTEFNLKDTTASGIAGTWAHGLFIATEVLLAVNSSRITGVNMHCAVAEADVGAVFADTASFDFDLSPDKSLVTAVFGRSATGFSTGLIGAAMLGATSASSLHFSSNPSQRGANGPYPSLVGASFSGGAHATAVIVNLAPTALDVGVFGGAFATFSSLSAADPTRGVNNAGKITQASGSVTASTPLRVPAYSVTSLVAA